MRRALGLGSTTSNGMLPSAMGSTLRETAPGTASRHRGDQQSRRTERVSYQDANAFALSQWAAALEAQLATEREHHAEARRTLERVELAMRVLRTRSEQHALAQQEELEGMRQKTMNAQRALDEAILEMEQRHDAQRAALARSQAAANPKFDASASAQPTAATPPKKRGRPRTSPLPEPKPVCWWTPSYRARTRG